MPRPPAPTPGTLLLAPGTAPTTPHVVDTTTTLVMRASPAVQRDLVRLTLHVRHAPVGAAVPAPQTTAAILASSPSTTTTTAPGAALASAFPAGTNLHDSLRSATDDAVQTVKVTWGQPLGTDLDPHWAPPAAVIAAYSVPSCPTFGTASASMINTDARYVEAMHVALIHGDATAGDDDDDESRVTVLFALQWARSSTGLFRASPGLGTVHRHYDAVRKATLEYWLDLDVPSISTLKPHIETQVAQLKIDVAAIKSAFRQHAALPRAFTPAPELRYLRRVHVAAHLATVNMNAPLPDGAAAIDVTWRLDVPDGWTVDEVPAAGAPRVVGAGGGGQGTQVLAGRAVVAVGNGGTRWWWWWWWVAWIAPLLAWLASVVCASWIVPTPSEIAVTVPVEWTLVQKSKLASPLVLYITAHALVTDPTDTTRPAARHLVGTGTVRIATDRPGRASASCRLARPRFPPHVQVVEWVLGTPAIAETEERVSVPPLIEAMLHAMGASANSRPGEARDAVPSPRSADSEGGGGRKHRRAQSDAVAATSSTPTTPGSNIAAVSHPALHAVAESPSITARSDRTVTPHRRRGPAFPTTHTATVSVLIDTAWHVAAGGPAPGTTTARSPVTARASAVSPTTAPTSPGGDPLARARARVLALRAFAAAGGAARDARAAAVGRAVARVTTARARPAGRGSAPLAPPAAVPVVPAGMSVSEDAPAVPAAAVSRAPRSLAARRMLAAAQSVPGGVVDGASAAGTGTASARIMVGSSSMTASASGRRRSLAQLGLGASSASARVASPWTAAGPAGSSGSGGGGGADRAAVVTAAGPAVVHRGDGGSAAVAVAAAVAPGAGATAGADASAQAVHETEAREREQETASAQRAAAGEGEEAGAR
ncbi:hypothetical protein GGF31_007002 [Allomyces arbusculus]|nr:hypothetical protein GGF31_007002 [Allomyces arbusculus]